MVSLAISKTPLFNSLTLQKMLERFNPRERVIIIGGTALVLLTIAIKLTQSAMEAFEEQSTQLASAQADLQQAGVLLKSYAKLQRRREEIEQEYRQVEFKEGALSHLESLVNEKLQLPSNQFKIEPRPAQPFGSSYEQSTFTISFKATSLEKLIGFLRAVTEGKHPMLLSRLEITRSYSGDRLDVEVDISSIHKPSPK